MPSYLDQFEAIGRALARLSEREPAAQPSADVPDLHSFDVRNLHSSLPVKVKKLFDDGHADCELPARHLRRRNGSPSVHLFRFRC